MFELESISVVYYKDTPEEVKALDSVNFTVAPSEFLAITGPSGSGKSTVLSVMGLLRTPLKGILKIDGQDVTKLNDSRRAEIRNRNFGFIFQQLYMIEDLNLGENVALPMKYARVGRSERLRRARDLLSRVGLENKFKAMPNTLSGGERQRGAIARALSMRPRFILADEPTGSLDSENGGLVMRMLKELNSNERVGVILVTHDEKIAGMALRRAMMKDGEFTYAD
ncbi:MAG: ABC transporter ATP-binding protein [Spirochaetia bacterium]|nr:ABC transporter ATP-binding protein [Spirochaetia bacterium]